eukprot:tig00000113_g5607.t1
MTTLTPEVLLVRVKNASSLEQVVNANLWGMGLADVGLLAKTKNIEVVTLVDNRVRDLSPFAQCTKLRELFLRKNAVSDLSELRHLAQLPQLTILSLNQNPIEQLPNYRNVCIKALPHLQTLDNSAITDAERRQAESVQLPWANSLPSAPSAPAAALAPAASSPPARAPSSPAVPLSPAGSGAPQAKPERAPSGSAAPAAAAAESGAAAAAAAIAAATAAGSSHSSQRGHTITAIKHLLKDLNAEDVRAIQRLCADRLKTLGVE